jgi:uncharacterized protein YndB with AHSA1/START domain
MGLNPHIEVSVHVDAPPEDVWRVVSDVTRSGEWSGESRGCEWLHGASSAEPGTRFKGQNLRRGWRWTRVSQIAKADRPRELVWRTLSTVIYPDSTEWRITLEPEAGGTRVTEEMQILRMSRLLDVFLYWFMPPHRDRTQDLQGDLQRLKAVVEAGAAGSESA